MISQLPLLLIFMALSPQHGAAISRLQFNPRTSLSTLVSKTWPSRRAISLKDRSNLNTNPNGSTFLWLPQDEYSGGTFFDGFDFFTGKDPTNGHVNYVNRSRAYDAQLVYTQDDGTVIMKGDDTTKLDQGVFRESVRISSYAQYNTGLFILDLNRAPWGCGTWPAFWTLGTGNWPYNGEIDIIEGVHDNEHNQVAWHTAPGCTLTPNTNFTGKIVQHNGNDNLDCNGLINDNSGCGVLEWSRASYGPYFDSIGGGVFAMKWDENGIAIWSFYRAAVPQDIVEGSPTPGRWGIPSAVLGPDSCDPLVFFKNHSIIFDITFCGDWAGNSYATSGCPGTCEDRLMDPANFVNASWSINSLKVYRKQMINGRITNSSTSLRSVTLRIWVLSVAMATILILL